MNQGKLEEFGAYQKARQLFEMVADDLVQGPVRGTTGFVRLGGCRHSPRVGGHRASRSPSGFRPVFPGAALRGGNFCPRAPRRKLPTFLKWARDAVKRQAGGSGARSESRKAGVFVPRK